MEATRSFLPGRWFAIGRILPPLASEGQSPSGLRPAPATDGTREVSAPYVRCLDGRLHPARRNARWCPRQRPTRSASALRASSPDRARAHRTAEQRLGAHRSQTRLRGRNLPDAWKAAWKATCFAYAPSVSAARIDVRFVCRFAITCGGGVSVRNSVIVPRTALRAHSAVARSAPLTAPATVRRQIVPEISRSEPRFRLLLSRFKRDRTRIGHTRSIRGGGIAEKVEQNLVAAGYFIGAPPQGLHDSIVSAERKRDEGHMRRDEFLREGASHFDRGLRVELAIEHKDRAACRRRPVVIQRV